MKRRAFTLIELLVAIAVLMVLLLFLVQIVAWVGKSWASGKQLADNLSKGRAAIDLITRDLQNGLFRPDLPAFVIESGIPSPLSSNYCFYVGRSGGGARALSLINYRLETNASLQRQVLPCSWGSSNNIAFGTNSIPAMASMASQGVSTELAEGVIAFGMYFINAGNGGANQAITPTYTNGLNIRTYAVGIGLVVIDEQTKKLLESEGKLQGLLDAGWEPPASLDRGLGAHWLKVKDDFLQNSASGYPDAIRSGIRVFESIVNLPVEPSMK